MLPQRKCCCLLFSLSPSSLVSKYATYCHHDKPLCRGHDPILAMTSKWRHILSRLTGLDRSLLCVIIPSNNEESCIQTCLRAVLEQTSLPANHNIQVIVAANGCHDRTVALANEMIPAFAAAGFDLTVLDIDIGNKINALNVAEASANHEDRVFIDADVVIDPPVLAALLDTLDHPTPIYASGAVRVPRPQSLISRAYAKVWTDMPFFRDGVPGIGLYAMNGAGRARWDEFPSIIADDRFVRLQFSPEERHKIKAGYDWPLPEGFNNLVHVRHRWREGNIELAEKFPELMANDSEINTSSSNALRLLRTPFASVIFVLIYLASNARARRTKDEDTAGWRRGRE